MSDRSSRKRRKPAKPSRHSPNSQTELLSNSTSSDMISPDEPQIIPENLATFQNSSNNVIKSSPTENHIMGSQMDVETYINDKRAKMSTSSNDQDDLDSRSGSPQDSLDLSIGSRSHNSSQLSSNTTSSKKQAPSLKSDTPLATNLSTKSNQSSMGVLPGSSPVISPSLAPAQSPGVPTDRSILTQYEELKSKAMTSRARRIIANARERNRVHTISSAFEQLRKSIPCYSGNQKLSKLAILKIATSYIRCLRSRGDFGARQLRARCSWKDPKLSELVMRCTVNVLSDGKLKRPEGNVRKTDSEPVTMMKNWTETQRKKEIRDLMNNHFFLLISHLTMMSSRFWLSQHERKRTNFRFSFRALFINFKLPI